MSVTSKIGEECGKRYVNRLVIIPRNMPTAEKWILMGSKYPPRHLSRVKGALFFYWSPRWPTDLWTVHILWVKEEGTQICMS